MGQWANTEGICRAMLGQLYCHRKRSIKQIVDHYVCSTNRRYLKNKDEEGPRIIDGLLADELLDFSLRFYVDERIIEFVPETPEQEAQMQLWLSGDYFQHEYPDGLIDLIPLRFSHGWRMRIKKIPVMARWRPDEPPYFVGWTKALRRCSQ